jgi:hypothetical protein
MKGNKREPDLSKEFVFPIYCARPTCVNLDWLQLCQIDLPRQPSRFGNGLPRSDRKLRFGFASQSPNSQNLTGRSIESYSIERWRDLEL